MADGGKTLHISEERIKLTRALMDATPTAEDYIREFGEDKYRERGTQWRVDLTDRHGQVDMRKVRLAKEMEQRRRDLAVKLAGLGNEAPVGPSYDDAVRWLRHVDPKGRTTHVYGGLHWHFRDGHWQVRTA